MNDSLAPSSHKTYMTGIRSYINFCQSSNLTCFPVNESSLCFFATFSCNRGIACKSIKVYIHGVINQNAMLGFHLSLYEMPILHRVIRGIRRRQGNSLTRPPRKPITVNHLRQISVHLNLHASLSAADKYMYLSACLVAFFGLLRVSEYTCPKISSFDTSLHLLRNDVHFNKDFSIMTLRIKASKTDPFRKGISIRISATNDSLCPVGVMRNYLALTPSYNGPLFQCSDGRFLTRNLILGILSTVFPNIADISTHSFRIGGASSALAAGASDSMIRILGRWSSDCYLRYLRISDSDITKFQVQM